VNIVYQRPNSLYNAATSYCPGCTHGTAHRLVAETIDELGIQGRTVGVASVGCSVFAYNVLDVDFQQAAHGRAPAVATGIKRVRPECIVFTYQGDGDLASIGMAEIVHAAVRGENITVIFINNAIYGMTGGQMAPTTLVGQKTTTSPFGRDPKMQGYPVKVSELLATVKGARYIARCSLHNPAAIQKAKQAVKKAFLNQVEGKGFSLVELLSTCSTNWGMTPQAALKWLEEKMIPEFPLGEFKNEEGPVA
jgi:2-oxoglutarate ferredoxin oxidoreductase subunit beta